MFCSSCGYELNEGDSICKGCGTMVSPGIRSRIETSFNAPLADLLFPGEDDEDSALQKITVIKTGDYEALRKAEEEAAVKWAAAKEAAAKEKAAKEKAVFALKEAIIREAAAKAAAAAEKEAAAVAEKATGDIEKAIKDSAKRTAEKKAALERAEAMKARDKAIALKEAAEKAAMEAAVKEAEARKAADEISAIKARGEAVQAALKEEKRQAAKEAATEKAAREAAAKTAAVKDADVPPVIKSGENAESAAPRLNYNITGGSFPSVSIILNADQSIYAKTNAMVWMSAGVLMKTSRGASSCMAAYTSGADGQEIGIASRFPGEVLCLDLGGGAVIAQKSAFLAAQPSVKLASHVSMHFGEAAQSSFVFQRLSGAGVAFVAIGGGMISRTLRPGETIKADVANVAAFEESISFQTEIISDFQNTPDGEGVLLATLSGPGRVWLQTLPVS